MYRYLIDHAIRNVWCTPEQDNQLIFSAQRLTRDYGELNKVYLMNREISLPVTGKRYHVYQIGQVLPRSLGLSSVENHWSGEKWVKFSEAITANKVLVNLYTAKGVQVPRFSSYYMFSNERNLIFAVEIDPTVNINYREEQLFIRFYSNAYYQSMEADATEDIMFCTGLKVANIQNILNLQNLISDYRLKPGSVQCYVNGLLVSVINPLTVKLGDCIEFVYDSSVKRVVTFTVNSVPTFNSSLDSKYKYLLHHLEGLNDTIDYHDDIDVNIISVGSDGVGRGLYYHRNNPDSHRMVTHRDYSIVVDYFDYIANALSGMISDVPLDIREFKLELTIRNSGYRRPLIHDNSRVFELYKLPDEKLVNAMTGVNATVAMWRAENLEESSYTALMRSKDTNVGMELVQEAYGYNSISKLIGDTPSRTVQKYGTQVADLPYGLQENSTIYEYNSNGHLLGFHKHSLGSECLATSSDVKTIEAVSGVGSYRPNVIFGTDNIPLPAIDNYRVYMCFLINEVPNNAWRDITGSEQYRVENGKLIWNNLQYGQFLMVRDDSTFLAYDLNLEFANGHLFFTLTEEENRGQGYMSYTLPVPLGEMDLFLNGKSLIKDLDYRVEFPKVYILNKSHLDQPALIKPQKVHVRMTGFCRSDLTMEPVEDFGFVQYGFLSNNSRYDIRDDKVLRITVDGSLKERSDLLFSEEHDGVSIFDPNNGKPYQIKDFVIPLKQLVNENTYSLREKSKAIDEEISSYLTVTLPQPLRDGVNAIQSKYSIVSPFISRVLNALLNEEIPYSVVNSTLADSEIIDACKPFEGLLTVDPINDELGYDKRFIRIVPHPNGTVMTLSLVQYRFITRVVKLYCKDMVDISMYLNFRN